MSDILNSEKILEKPKAQEVTDDLAILEAKSDYKRTNVLRWFLLILMMVFISSITMGFLWAFFTVDSVKKFVFSQIQNNIVFIILSVFAMLKIKLPDIKR